MLDAHLWNLLECISCKTISFDYRNLLLKLVHWCGYRVPRSSSLLEHGLRICLTLGLSSLLVLLFSLHKFGLYCRWGSKSYGWLLGGTEGWPSEGFDRGFTLERRLWRLNLSGMARCALIQSWCALVSWSSRLLWYWNRLLWRLNDLSYWLMLAERWEFLLRNVPATCCFRKLAGSRGNIFPMHAVHSELM